MMWSSLKFSEQLLQPSARLEDKEEEERVLRKGGFHFGMFFSGHVPCHVAGIVRGTGSCADQSNPGGCRMTLMLARIW
jgi:hypothetical protein